MELRARMLGAVALVGALALSPSAFAAGTPQTNPTPQDRAATEKASEDSLARTRAAADADAAAVQRYQAQQATVMQERARLAAERAVYNREMAGRRWLAFYGHERFVEVMGVPRGRLIGRTVSARGGSVVGRITDIDVTGAGRVAISVRTGGTAWIDAQDVRFDPNSRVVYTDLSRDQIGAMANMRYPRF